MKSMIYEWVENALVLILCGLTAYSIWFGMPMQKGSILSYVHVAISSVIVTLLLTRRALRRWG